MVFFNRRFWTTQNFEIKKSSLKINRKHMFEAVEYEIPFYLINNNLKTQTIINNNVIIVGVFFFAFSFLFLIGDNEGLTLLFILIAFLFITIPFFNRKKVISISCADGHLIELFFNHRNKLEVTEYARSIIDAANNFLLHKYGKIDRLLPIEPQIENIQYLLNREIITEENFENLKNQLLGTENKKSIGFGQN